MLLDTHAFYWLVGGDTALSDNASDAIVESQRADRLYVSPISAWELAIATGKTSIAGRPNLGDDSPDRWFRQAIAATGARIVPIHQRIAVEAAEVVAATGHKDPGDCFLIATARIRRMPLVTRDAAIRAIAAADPGYLSVIVC